MNNTNGNFNIENIKSVDLTLLDGQVEIILRGLELFGYNLEFMLNGSDSSEELRQEKMALVRYTYEQILSTQAEQVNGKSNNIENLSNLGKKLLKGGKIVDILPQDRKFNIV